VLKSDSYAFEIEMSLENKVVNTCLILLEVLVSHTVEVRKYHINCRLNFESFIRYCRFCVDKGHSLFSYV